MIDARAGRNVIELNIIEHDVEINKNKILRLTEINNVHYDKLHLTFLDILQYLIQ